MLFSLRVFGVKPRFHPVCFDCLKCRKTRPAIAMIDLVSTCLGVLGYVRRFDKLFVLFRIFLTLFFVNSGFHMIATAAEIVIFSSQRLRLLRISKATG